MNLRAVIQSAPRESVMEIASTLDEERRRGLVRGELHGIPILVKDNIATDPELDMETTAGSLALKGSTVVGDAFVVDKLRKAGAIIIAKTNMNELAGWKGVPKDFGPIPPPGNKKDNVTFKPPSNGWSAAGGQCISAYVERGDPMGSSSGSAVGLSVGWGVSALGSDTLESVLGPASRAALYAVRPTIGRLSRKGVLPISLDHDTVGPMGFTTYDVALMLEIMSGADHDDRSTHHIPPLTNLTKIALDPPDLSHFTIGIPTRYFSDNSMAEPTSGCPLDSDSKVNETLAYLERHHGLNLKWGTDINFTSTDEVNRLLQVITQKLAIDFRSDLNDYLKDDLRESGIRDMLDLAMFNDMYSAQELPPNQCCQERILSSLVAPPRNSTKHQHLTPELKDLADNRGLAYIFEQNPDIDAIALDYGLGAPCWWVGAAGYPASIVPLGYCADGLPFGMMSVTRRFDEHRLISIMAAYESVMPKRQIPKPYHDRYGSERF